MRRRHRLCCGRSRGVGGVAGGSGHAGRCGRLRRCRRRQNRARGSWLRKEVCTRLGRHALDGLLAEVRRRPGVQLGEASNTAVLNLEGVIK